MQHVATGYTGDVQECEEVWQEWHKVLCAKCARAGGRKGSDEFLFEDVKLECVYKFAYLCDMLNDTGGVEQAVAVKVRAAWMKFRELDGILCTRGASLRMKAVVYKACVTTMGDESRDVSEAACH